jgi:ketosteroid isomerase-like protein
MSDEAYKAADALGAAIHARDADAIRAIYADNIVVWHGSTGQAQTRDENAGLLAGVFQITSALEYVDIKRHVIEGGIVQQHRLVGTFDDGKPMPGLNACLVIKVSGGLITSIEEYFDGATYAEVWERLAALADAESTT